MSETDEPEPSPDKPQPSQERLFERLKMLRAERHDFLKENLEKARRDLLVASMVTFVISVTGAVPTKIEALGVEFSKLEQRWIFAFLGLIAIYFVFKFHFERLSDNTVRRMIGAIEKELEDDRIETSYYYSFRLPAPIMILGIQIQSYLRNCFDSTLPYVVGLIAIIVAAYAAFTGHSVLQPV